MPRGKPFAKGKDDRRVGAGRPPGSPNKITVEIKQFFSNLVNDPEVQQAVRDGIVGGDKGYLQAFLGASDRVLGKPKETVQIDTTPNMAKLIQLAIAKADERAAAQAKAKEKAS